MKKQLLFLSVIIVSLLLFWGTGFLSSPGPAADQAAVFQIVPSEFGVSSLISPLPQAEPETGNETDAEHPLPAGETEEGIDRTDENMNRQTDADVTEISETETDVDRNGEQTDLTAEVKTPQKPDPASEKNPISQAARVTASGLNVRTGPSADTERIDILELGQTVDVLGEQSGWLQIKMPDGRTGWISGRYAAVFTRNGESSSNTLAGKVITIDPGHGGTDPGAVGVTGLREKDVVLDVSLRVAESLRNAGATVIQTRDSDVFIPLSQRVSIAERAGTHIYVSIHANAHPSAQIGGIETYYFRNKANANASYLLAAMLQQELVGRLALRDIGVKHGNFLVIRQTSMPSALVELGFLSNAREESLMRTDEFRQGSADAIVNGIIKYFE